MALAIGGQAQQIMTNLSGLGVRKLSALGLVGLLVLAVVGLGSYYLSRPDMEVLYSGLDRTDVTRIGAALTEAGIAFDVSAKGDAILTPFASTAPARMLLAEKGLPRSENAGYELFDNLGSIGLTSFMQEITRVRALEGEIARTIQSLAHIRAARVHIVLPDEGSFRRNERKPSASVVIRTDQPEDFSSAQAIRQLVSSAIPGMTPDEVTILSSDGTLLASGDDSASSAPTKLFGIERIVAKSVEDSIRRTLSPYLGIGNFQTSVTARLNTDRRLISERTFDPDVRVERSIRSIRENGESENSTKENAVGVQQDIQPAGGQAATSSGQTSKDNNERREEPHQLRDQRKDRADDERRVQRREAVDRGRGQPGSPEGVARGGRHRCADRRPPRRASVAHRLGSGDLRRARRPAQADGGRLHRLRQRPRTHPGTGHRRNVHAPVRHVDQRLHHPRRRGPGHLVRSQAGDPCDRADARPGEFGSGARRRRTGRHRR
nr:flagellar basal-body MS-ring/collar protein FliF [Jiella pelagia]